MEVIWVKIALSRDLNGGFGSSSFASPVTTSSDFLDVNFPFMSNSMGFNFLNPSDLYSVGFKNNTTDESGVNEFAGSSTASAISDSRYSYTIEDGTVVPKFNDVADLSEVTSTAGEAEEAIEAVSSGEAIAEGSNPVGLALLVNQQLGSAVNNTMNQGTEQQITKDMILNSQQNGLNVGLNTQLIRAAQEQTRSNQDLGGTIGSLFGPLGALIGHAIAGVVQPDANLLNTANSFQGAVNPSDTGAVASASTASLTGQSNLVDNVDTANI